ncbi:MAG: serine hydrolase domain-containing protein [Blautia sp.]|jgi:CubicO group peptidase (beta-lactamase class C family)
MDQEKIQALEKKISEEYSNMAGIVVRKEGRTFYEHYFNGCTADSRIHVYSLTKSIISMLVGIALDKGYIRSVDQKVLDFFPDYSIKKGEKTIQKITLKHLLTMTAPYKFLIPPYVKYFTSGDSVRFTLDLLGGRGKIGEFKYMPLIGPDILSGVLIKATGQSVFDFAAENLFSPLGITVVRNVVFQSKEEQLSFNQSTDISGWVADAAGTNHAGWGLTLSPVDMAKLGQMYLDDGVWDGEQIVSKEWVAESTAKQSWWEREKLSYGYLWWLAEDGFAAMGDGGNVIYVNREKHMVVAVTSLFQKKAKDRIELIKGEIEPLFG